MVWLHKPQIPSDCHLPNLPLPNLATFLPYKVTLLTNSLKSTPAWSKVQGMDQVTDTVPTSSKAQLTAQTTNKPNQVPQAPSKKSLKRARRRELLRNRQEAVKLIHCVVPRVIYFWVRNLGLQMAVNRE